MTRYGTPIYTWRSSCKGRYAPPGPLRDDPSFCLYGGMYTTNREGATLPSPRGQPLRLPNTRSNRPYLMG
ncbi:hypothetical protein BJY00DRAFT_285828 [Aspergillus carlsbadensis]|nr:hypothetical protein BJY00DRAFT_285828 [Aspergillus carlsbadensis]